MNTLKGLQPDEVWSRFEEICQVPRPSKKEEKITEYLLSWAKENNIEAKSDKAGNVVMKKPATPGKENTRSVVMQSHMDMVCEKNSDVDFNFETDAIKPYIDGEWIKAKGTTLGADDGIGMAAQLAVLASDNIAHGPVECLFTVDEETGLTGAFEMEPGFFESKILLNLDSEDEGEIFIGCAGGIDTTATMKYKKEAVPENHVAFHVKIYGLKGGHSGDDINKGLGNSNKILNRILWHAGKNYGLRLSDFNGGNLRNAIPREAAATFVIPGKHSGALEKFISEFCKKVKFELQENEPDLSISLEKVSLPAFVTDTATQSNLLNALYACPHGVIAMSYKLKGLVETSTNLASV
ncbi:MAG: beta-Ala-His dipeptidase, partial [Bacteroidetes bacterium]|nr:beta-Ala-His dipeptidase [Bacteroidota bacterium]